MYTIDKIIIVRATDFLFLLSVRLSFNKNFIIIVYISKNIINPYFCTSVFGTKRLKKVTTKIKIENILLIIKSFFISSPLFNYFLPNNYATSFGVAVIVTLICAAFSLVAVGA